MVFLGLKRAESLSTRGSGTLTTAVCTSKRPPPVIWPTGRLPRVSALKIVVLPDWGSPMIPRRMMADYRWRMADGSAHAAARTICHSPSALFSLTRVYAYLILPRPCRGGGMAYAVVSKTTVLTDVRVRLPPSAQQRDGAEPSRFFLAQALYHRRLGFPFTPLRFLGPIPPRPPA